MAFSHSLYPPITPVFGLTTKGEKKHTHSRKEKKRVKESEREMVLVVKMKNERKITYEKFISGHAK